MIHDILAEINESNKTNHKIDVLRKYQDNKELQNILKLTYDTVQYTYGVTLQQIDKFEPEKYESNMDLHFACSLLVNKLSNRTLTGHAALQFASDLIGNLDEKDKDLFRKIINRDLRINLGKTQINKVFKGLITKPAYMRCDTFSKKNSKNINFPAIVQLKADGTYREFNVHNGHVTSRSRSGESYEYPIIFDQMKVLPDGIYIGELTVNGYKDRAKGNGLINSDNPPHDDIIVELWDYITPKEYEQAQLRDKNNPCTIPYKNRLDFLVETCFSHNFSNVKIIPFYWVQSLENALEYTSKWMNEGFEGAILKDKSLVFKDGTSKQQLKLKLEISAEMRCVGFNDGRVGTKREGKVGSIIFANDEGTIKGSCSGFTDSELDFFTENKDSLIGNIMEVQFNDITKSESNDFHAFSHPRFIEWRADKDETDSLEKVFKLKEMAMNLS